MRFVPKKITLIIIAIYMLPHFIFAEPAPPAPAPQGAPPPPGTPVDEGILLLLVISLVFGIYKIYKSNIKKASC